jgi:hypothetical protein
LDEELDKGVFDQTGNYANALLPQKKIDYMKEQIQNLEKLKPRNDAESSPNAPNAQRAGGGHDCGH